MKVWLDTKLLFQHTADRVHDCDCDCAPDDFMPPPALDDISSLCTLQLAGSLYVQAFDNSLWLICNPVDSGKIAVVDAEAYALLESFRTPRMFQDIVSHAAEPSLNLVKSVALFIGLGFLQCPDRPEFSNRQGTQQTLSAWLHVTNACNLGCHYCYVSKTSEAMADDTSQRAIDAVVRSAVRNRFKRIRLKYAGGEASLLLSRVLAIHDYALQQASVHGLDLSASILSNGVMLSQRAIDQFKERHIGVTISLDGIGQDHDQQRPFRNGRGSFLYIDRTITRLIASGLMPHINVVVSQRNLKGLPDLIEYILDRDMSFTLSYYRDNDCSSQVHDLQFLDTQMIDAMRALFSSIAQRIPKRKLIGSLIDKANMTAAHQHTCSAGRSYLVINQRGGVAKCPVDVQNAVTTIETDDPLQAIRDDRNGMYALPVENKEGCRSCQWRHWCAGGCPLLTYRMTGRNDIKSPNCNIYKALFPEAVRLEALRLLTYESPVLL